jgi:hypothetical protein
MEILRTVRSLSPIQKVILGTGVALFLYTLVGFFAVPPILKYFLKKNLTEILHREVAIEKVRVNPYLLSLRVSGFTIGERDIPEPFVSFDSLYGNLEIVSLFRLGVVLKEIRVEAPYIHVARKKDGKYNFSDLIKEFATKKAPPPGSGPSPPAKPLRFSLNNIQIRNGSADFDDVPKETRHTVREVRIDIPLLSNFPYHVDTFVQPVLEANVNGTAISLGGKTRPFKDTYETTFNIDIRKVDIPHYLEYVPFPLNFDVRSAFLDTKGTVTFAQHKDRAPTLGFTGRIAFEAIDVLDPGGKPLLRLPLLDLSIASSELISRKVRFSSILVQSPELHLAMDGTGKLNLTSLLSRRKTGEVEEETKGEEAQEAERETRVSIEADTIRVAGGTVEFMDASRAAPFRSTLSPVDLEVEHFSNADRKKSAFKASIETESKETVGVDGEFTVSPPSSEGGVELGKVRPAKYSPYFADRVLFDVENGVFDLSTRYTVSGSGQDQAINLSGLKLALRSLRLRKRGEKADFLAIPALDVGDTSLDLSGKRIVIGEVSSRKGLLLVNRLKGEKWNLSTLVPPGLPDVEDARPKEETRTENGIPWRVVVQNARLDGYTVKMEDASASEPVTLTADRIAFRGSNLSTEKGKRGRASFSFTLNENGSVAAEGDVGIDPAFARLKITGNAVDIVPLQPYFTERMNVIVRSGAVFADGTLSIASPEDGGLESAYTGKVSLRNFASTDKENAEDFLNIASLDLTGIDVGVSPASTRVEIARVGLTDFYLRFVIYNEGGLNFRRIFKWKEGDGAAGGAGEEQGKPPVAPPKVTVAQVILQGGTIQFSDYSIQPDFSAKMLDVEGEISGLSSEGGRQAEVNLEGNLGKQAPLVIAGKLNPFPDKLYVDLKVTFKDLDLVPVTPYSGKYAGYTIRKGKLSVDLHYLIVGSELDSLHRVSLDQLTLGDRVDSPEATTLPVKLGIALLKDRKGVIELNLPVTGNLSDPQFRVSGVILKILKNILVKAATSPFALLGAIAGGGEELSYLEFEYGSAAIPRPGEEKLSGIAKVLFERPALKMEIEGHVDPEKDGEELRTILFQRKLKAQKLKDTVGKGKAGIAVDEVVITPEEYPKYLKMAYKAEKFPKPRNFLGIAKSIPVPEMEKLMYDNIEVTKDDLRLLAMQRAQNVSDYLQAKGNVEANRLFLVEPASLQPEKKEKLKGSRVNFRIK